MKCFKSQIKKYMCWRKHRIIILCLFLATWKMDDLARERERDDERNFKLIRETKAKDHLNHHDRGIGEVINVLSSYIYWTFLIIIYKTQSKLN